MNGRMGDVCGSTNPCLRAPTPYRGRGEHV
jgi:hypothetical protein